MRRHASRILSALVAASALLVAVLAVQLLGGRSAQSAETRNRPQDSTGGSASSVSTDELQRSIRINRYQLVAASGAARGETIYFYKCWVCHNKYQQGNPRLSDVFKDANQNSPMSDDALTAQIKNGSEGMPSFKTSMSDSDVADLVSYLKSGKCCVEGEDPPRNPWYRAASNPWPVQTTTSGGARGVVRIPSGDSPEGVKVQLVAPNGVRTTVYTNDRGYYEFPKMQAGDYTLRIPTPLEFKPYERDAVRIDGATQLDDIVLDRVSSSEFLPATSDIESQLSGAELLWNLSGTVQEKKIFRGCGCHSWQQVLRNRYDERSWRVLVHRMLHYNGAPLINPTTAAMAGAEGRSDRAENEELIVKWLSRVRGPESKDAPVVAFPRPRGAATRVVITEYELPRVLLSPHDVAGDSKGNIWFSSHKTRFVGRLDPRTGVITEYALPLTPGALPGTHRVTVDKNDNAWFSEPWAHLLTKFDLRTQEFTQVKVEEPSYRPINSPGFNNFALAPDGYVWNTQDGAAVKIDPKTGKVLQKYPMNVSETYDNTISHDGNFWAGGSPAGGGNSAHFLDIRTGKMLNFSTGASPSNSRRGGFDPFGNAWFGGGNGTITEVDAKAGMLREYNPPIPYSPYEGFYEAMPDKNGEVWAGELVGRGFLRFNPKTERWIEYVMPEPFGFDRRTWIDNSTNPVTVWYVDYQGYIVRIQPLE